MDDRLTLPAMAPQSAVARGHRGGALRGGRSRRSVRGGGRRRRRALGGTPSQPEARAVLSGVALPCDSAFSWSAARAHFRPPRWIAACGAVNRIQYCLVRRICLSLRLIAGAGEPAEDEADVLPYGVTPAPQGTGGSAGVRDGRACGRSWAPRGLRVSDALVNIVRLWLGGASPIE